MYIAIVPARGSSRRLSRKNVRPLLGRPVLAYPIEAALRSGVFGRVIVSTEDAEIGDAARQAGAEVVERPAFLAGDNATMVEVCRQVLESVEGEGPTPEALCCLFATAALVTEEDLRDSCRLFESDRALDGVIATSDFNLSPLQAFRKEDHLIPMFPDYYALNTRHHPPLVGDAGAFYWIWTEAFLREKTFLTSRLQGYPLPRDRAVDINTIEDWRLMECLMRLRIEKARGDA